MTTVRGFKQNNPHTEMLKRQTAAWPQVRIYRALPNLAALLADADLAIGAGGVTTWERTHARALMISRATSTAKTLG